jgi:hypothetical protein
MTGPADGHGGLSDSLAVREIVPAISSQSIGDLTADLFEQASVSKSPIPPFSIWDVQPTPTGDQRRILHRGDPKRRQNRRISRR